MPKMQYKKQNPADIRQENIDYLKLVLKQVSRKVEDAAIMELKKRFNAAPGKIIIDSEELNQMFITTLKQELAAERKTEEK